MADTFKFLFDTGKSVQNIQDLGSNYTSLISLFKKSTGGKTALEGSLTRVNVQGKEIIGTFEGMDAIGSKWVRTISSALPSEGFGTDILERIQLQLVSATEKAKAFNAELRKGQTSKAAVQTTGDLNRGLAKPNTGLAASGATSLINQLSTLEREAKKISLPDKARKEAEALARSLTKVAQTEIKTLIGAGATADLKKIEALLKRVDKGATSFKLLRETATQGLSKISSQTESVNQKVKSLTEGVGRVSAAFQKQATAQPLGKVQDSDIYLKDLAKIQDQVKALSSQVSSARKEKLVSKANISLLEQLTARLDSTNKALTGLKQGVAVQKDLDKLVSRDALSQLDAFQKRLATLGAKSSASGLKKLQQDIKSSVSAIREEGKNLAPDLRKGIDSSISALTKLGASVEAREKEITSFRKEAGVSIKALSTDFKTLTTALNAKGDPSQARTLQERIAKTTLLASASKKLLSAIISNKDATAGQRKEAQLLINTMSEEESRLNALQVKQAQASKAVTSANKALKLQVKRLAEIKKSGTLGEQIAAFRKLSKTIGDGAKSATTAKRALLLLRRELKAVNSQSSALALSFKNFAKFEAFSIIRNAVHGMVNQFKEGVSEALKLGKAIAEIQTIAQGTSPEGLEDILRAESVRTGIDVLTQAEAAYQAFSNQVVHSEDQLRSFLEVANTLAVGSVASTEEAVNALSSALNSYGEGTLLAEQASATFFKTVELGRVRLSEMSNTIGTVLVPAAQLGISFEEVASGLALTTQQGIKYNKAQTLMRAIILKLIKPTEEMKNLFSEWGVETGEAAIQTFGFQGVLAKIEEATKGSSSELGKLLSRVRAITQGMIFSGENGQKYAEILGEMRGETLKATAASVAQVKALSGLSPTLQALLKDFDGLEDAVSGTGITEAFSRIQETDLQKLNKELEEIKEIFADLGKDGIEFIKGLTDDFKDLSEIVRFGVDSLKALSAGFVTFLALGAAVKIATIGQTILGLSNLALKAAGSTVVLQGGLAGVTAGVRALSVALFTSPLGLVALLAAGVATGFYLMSDSANQAEVSVGEGLTNSIKELDKVIEGGKKARELRIHVSKKAVEDDIKQVTKFVSDLSKAFPEIALAEKALSGEIDSAVEAAENLDNVFDRVEASVLRTTKAISEASKELSQLRAKEKLSASKDTVEQGNISLDFGSGQVIQQEEDLKQTLKLQREEYEKLLAVRAKLQVVRTNSLQEENERVSSLKELNQEIPKLFKSLKLGEASLLLQEIQQFAPKAGLALQQALAEASDNSGTLIQQGLTSALASYKPPTEFGKAAAESLRESILSQINDPKGVEPLSLLGDVANSSVDQDVKDKLERVLQNAQKAFDKDFGNRVSQLPKIVQEALGKFNQALELRKEAVTFDTKAIQETISIEERRKKNLESIQQREQEIIDSRVDAERVIAALRAKSAEIDFSTKEGGAFLKELDETINNLEKALGTGIPGLKDLKQVVSVLGRKSTIFQRDAESDRLASPVKTNLEALKALREDQRRNAEAYDKAFNQTVKQADRANTTFKSLVKTFSEATSDRRFGGTLPSERSFSSEQLQSLDSTLHPFIQIFQVLASDLERSRDLSVRLARQGGTAEERQELAGLLESLEKAYLARKADPNYSGPSGVATTNSLGNFLSSLATTLTTAREVAAQKERIDSNSSKIQNISKEIEEGIKRALRGGDSQASFPGVENSLRSPLPVFTPSESVASLTPIKIEQVNNLTVSEPLSPKDFVALAERTSGKLTKLVERNFNPRNIT